MKTGLLKPLCLFFALILCLAAASCAAAGEKVDTTAASGGTAEATDGETAEISTEPDYYRNVDKARKYDNEEFLILSYDAKTWNIYLTAEETNGSLLNDAAFRRNAEVEELLGIRITTVLFPQTQLATKVLAANSSGGDGSGYDLCCFWATTNLANLITSNAVENWKKLDGVNLSEPWYNQSANRAFDLAGKQYIAVSDLTYTVQQHFRFLCNLPMLEDRGLKKPYALVDSGDWTIEALMNYIKDVYDDADADQQKSAGDTYGLATTVNGTSRFINNWDASPARTTDSGFELLISGDRIQSMVEKMNALQHSPDTWTYPNVNYDVFNEGRALFEIYSSDPDLLREITFDYAYLPYPKYDADQIDYITVTHGGIMAIPGCCSDLSRAGNVIEALSAGSAKHIKDSFIESYFNNRILRDADSVRMYRLMRDTAYFDVARYIDPSGKLSTLGYYTDLLKANDSNLSKQYTMHAGNIVKTFANFWEGLKRGN